MDKFLLNEAIQATELIDIFLYSSSINRYEEIFQDMHPEDMQQQSKLSVSAEFLEPEESDLDYKRFIFAKLTFGIRLVQPEEDGKNKRLSQVEACFLAKYAVKNSVSDEALEEFVKYNIVHNVWPFWREHALRMSAEACLPRPRIPFFHNGKEPHKIDKQDERSPNQT